MTVLETAGLIVFAYFFLGLVSGAILFRIDPDIDDMIEVDDLLDLLVLLLILMVLGLPSLIFWFAVGADDDDDDGGAETESALTRRTTVYTMPLDEEEEPEMLPAPEEGEGVRLLKTGDTMQFASLDDLIAFQNGGMSWEETQRRVANMKERPVRGTMTVMSVTPTAITLAYSGNEPTDTKEKYMSLPKQSNPSYNINGDLTQNVLNESTGEYEEVILQPSTSTPKKDDFDCEAELVKYFDGVEEMKKQSGIE